MDHLRERLRVRRLQLRIVAGGIRGRESIANVIRASHTSTLASLILAATFDL